MLPRIQFVERLTDGLVVLSYEGDRAVWSKCRLRKRKQCQLTGVYMEPGTEVYRPIGNQMYRMDRVGAEAMEQAIDFIEKAYGRSG